MSESVRFWLIMGFWGGAVVLGLRWVWKKVGEEDARLEYREAIRREAEALNYDEYEEPLPPVA